MAKKETKTYECEVCQFISASFLGRCPECQTWGSLAEKISAPKPMAASARLEAWSDLEAVDCHQPLLMDQVPMDSGERYPSGFAELDRVLGGGITPGSYTLVAGDPGIGKSTLLLQMATQLAKPLSKENLEPKRVLYVAGEESAQQIKQRASRLDLGESQLFLYPSNNVQAVIQTLKQHQPDVVIIDSIQSLYHPSLTATPGSPSQVRECAGLLMTLAKSRNMAIFLIGHVTKEGQVSGPKLLEHTVDTVLYFEGEKYKNLRILRTMKNRFGSTQEIGVFEMGTHGLREVQNPSELFLSNSQTQNLPGSVIVPIMEGTRPLLVEIQALVGQSTYSAPRRIGTGIETNRLHQIIAVLERRLGMNFSQQDVYVNVVGGLDVDEPAADLGIALALITSQRELAIQPKTVVFGEIGLTGEVRPVRQMEQRLLEAQKIGFRQAIFPALPSEDVKSPHLSTIVDTAVHASAPTPDDKIQCWPVDSVMAAIQRSLTPTTSPTGIPSQNNPEKSLTPIA